MDRPSAASVPAFVARLRFGRMADETILAGQKVIPRRLMDRGFRFEYPFLRGALEHLLLT
jgi:NAD dependent epimerase/dehydratase family enzyme